MRSRVVVRAFYEDAYLDFFINYYIKIGFDEIVILKADTDIKYNLDNYDLPINLTENEKCKVKVIHVKNTGNNIIQEYYNEFKTKNVDWVLNIDCDEFLILDWGKYKGINDYLKKYCNELVTNKLVDNIKDIQQLKYRWFCINKLNNDWSDDKNNILGYLQNYPLEVYKYIKSFGSTKHLIDKNKRLNFENDNQTDKNKRLNFENDNQTDKNKRLNFENDNQTDKTNIQVDNKLINCHFYYIKNIGLDLSNSYVKSKNNNIKNRNYISILNNKYCDINDSNPRTFPKDDTCGLNGFILHINSRSLTNTLTKCLITELRNNKKITNLPKFKLWLSSINLEDLVKYKLQYNKYKSKIEIIKNKFNYFLNNKFLFTKKINKFHSIFKKYLNENEILNLTVKKCLYSSLLFNSTTKITQLPFCNINLENKILKQLCNEKDIDYIKLNYIMDLYKHNYN